MAGSRNHGWITKKKDGFDIYVFERTKISNIYKPTARFRKGVFSITVMERLEEPDINQIHKDVWWAFREHGKRIVVVNQLAKRKGLTPTQVEIYWRVAERPSIEQVKEWYEELKNTIRSQQAHREVGV